jgi:hypothetical protein
VVVTPGAGGGVPSTGGAIGDPETTPGAASGIPAVGMAGAEAVGRAGAAVAVGDPGRIAAAWLMSLWMMLDDTPRSLR